MIHIHMAPDRNTNSASREFLMLNLPENIYINGFPIGKWEFELKQKIAPDNMPTVGTVATDMRWIKIKLNPDKSVPEWVIGLALKIAEHTQNDVDIFLER